jgi:alcohol dehydrogenase
VVPARTAKKQLYAHCRNDGGWILGYMIDGTQAEYVRTPFADTSLYPLPAELNEDVARVAIRCFAHCA